MANSIVNGVMCGTGEYTTGFVHSGGSKSDKKIGVVALCLFELRRLGKVGNLALVGTTGKKFEGIRQHLAENIRDVYNGLDVTCTTYPADDVDRDPDAYKAALDSLSPGDFCTIFTPDDTHFDIAMYAIQRGLHVLITKPAVKTLKDHRELVEAARKNKVFVMVEFHKRFDPIYADARAKARAFGDFGYFSSYMSQPKFQLDTFRAWAGKSSDISYYLNSHHIDVHCWIAEGKARPVWVTAMGATGVAESATYKCPAGTEDTITILCQWENLHSKTLGTAVYTASWSAAAKAEVHSQQKFHYMGHTGELRVDQAHRGFEVADDSDGYRSVNPLYMSYSKDHEGNFAGHHGYGYKSLATFIETCIAVNAGKMDCEPKHLPTLAGTMAVTAILEAGRISLDNGGRHVRFVYGDNGEITGYA